MYHETYTQQLNFVYYNVLKSADKPIFFSFINNTT